MDRRPRSRSSRWLTLCLLAFIAVAPTESAFALRDHTIVLRAAGSGAVLGLVVGVLSYPLAKSSGTIVGGAVVGVILGTVYGFYAVDERDKAYQEASLVRPSLSDDLLAMNASRNAILRRGAPSRVEFAAPFASFEF